MNKLLQESADHLHKIEEGHIQKLNEYDTDLAKIELSYKQRLDNAAQRGETLEHEAFQLIREKIDGNANKLQHEIDTKFNGIEEESKSGQKDLIELFGKTRSEITIWQTEVAHKMKESDERVASQKMFISEKIESLFEEMGRFKEDALSKMEEANSNIPILKEKLLAEVEDIEAKVVESVEHRLEDYESDANYRFNKLKCRNLKRSIRMKCALFSIFKNMNLKKKS